MNVNLQPQTIHGLAPPRWLSWTLLIILLLGTAGEFTWRGPRRALSDMEDFGIVYESARAFADGRNPYDSLAMRRSWQETSREQQRDILVPTPGEFSLYPPATYLVLSPLALMKWNLVKWVWLSLNLLSLAVLLATLRRIGQLPPWKTALTAAFILGFGPIHTAIAKGQLVIILAAILALALVAEVSKADVLAAILVGFAASLKPQIAAPVFLLYLVQRRWKPLAVAAGLSVGLLCVAWIRLSWIHVSWIPSLIQNVGAATHGGVYDPSPQNPLAYQLIDASALLHRLTNDGLLIVLLMAIIGVSVCVLLWKRGQYRPDLLADPTAFAGVCVMGLVLISHRYYDAAVLVFVFVWALAASPSLRAAKRVSIVGCIIMAFPVPALLVSLGYAHAPSGIPQTLWGAVVIQQQSWILLAILIALATALRFSRERIT
jgi:Glycosyltransferase family 87